MADIKDLKFYAQMIQDKRIEIMQIEQRVTRNKRDLAVLDLEISQEVAFNENLKNEAQRKTARECLISSNDTYQEIIRQIENDRFEIERLEIALEFWRNELSIGKLELRQKINEVGLMSI